MRLSGCTPHATPARALLCFQGAGRGFSIGTTALRNLFVFRRQPVESPPGRLWFRAEPATSGRVAGAMPHIALARSSASQGTVMVMPAPADVVAQNMDSTDCDRRRVTGAHRKAFGERKKP